MRLRLADDERLEWTLVGYSRETDYVASELVMTSEQRTALGELFDQSDDPWMIYIYVVTSTMWPRLQDLLQCGPPEPGQIYHVECHRVKVQHPDDTM